MGKSNRDFKSKVIILSLVGLVFVVGSFLVGGNRTSAEGSDPTIEELQNKILEKNKDIQQIDSEIKKYQTQLQTVSKEANTLQSAVKSLDINQNKLQKDLQLTKSKIDSTSLNLSRLEIEIRESEDHISQNSKSLAETIRLIDDAGQTSMIEAMLQYSDLSSFWNDVDSLEKFQVSVKRNLENIKIAKEVLEGKRQEDQKRKGDLESLKGDLSSQKDIVEVNKKQKSELLQRTKNTESEYQKILEQNIQRKKEFEKELFDFESQLQIKIDPSKIPSAHAGILAWPLETIKITQLFGKTVDSKKLYVSGTHNGVDFGASVGTKVKTAGGGVISHMGNTDEIPGCYSFGRWILVNHNNGLSTLYAHLSAVEVQVGQTVTAGQIIAFSGGMPGTSGAGYSTGPHLHFGLYATEGLRPQRYTSTTPCNGAYLPLADQKAYLDPMVYLPTI